ncbi:MAG: hypothetical protein ACREBR_02320, partial [bacterium]
ELSIAFLRYKRKEDTQEKIDKELAALPEKKAKVLSKLMEDRVHEAFCEGLGSQMGVTAGQEGFMRTDQASAERTSASPQAFATAAASEQASEPESEEEFVNQDSVSPSIDGKMSALPATEVIPGNRLLSCRASPPVPKRKGEETESFHFAQSLAKLGGNRN